MTNQLLELNTRTLSLDESVSHQVEQHCETRMGYTKVSDLLAAIESCVAVGLDKNSTFGKVRIDSRQIEPGDVFWALPGENGDGHDFIHDAYSRGAKFCVVNENQSTPGLSNAPAVHVTDTLAALSQFAAWYRNQWEPLVIGVTGSVGKTTTREMIHAVLGAEHSGISSIGNFNNEIGLPLSLLQLEEHHDYGVLEMGACRPGDIEALSRIAKPEIGVVTGIGPAHLEKFGSLENVVRTKAELLTSLPESGITIVNGDDEHAAEIAAYAKCPVTFIGESDKNDIQATHVLMGQHWLSFSVQEQRYEVPVCGRHNLHAAVAAVAVGLQVGMRPKTIAQGLRQFEAAEGRCRIRYIGSWTIVDDTYNANPASMRAACQLMAAWKTRTKKLAIVGDMLELGSETSRYHRELGTQIAEGGIDCLLAHGDYAHDVLDGAVSVGMDIHQMADCTTLESLFANLDCWLEPGDVMLVKGSRSTKMERVIDWARKQAVNENHNRAIRTPA